MIEVLKEKKQKKNLSFKEKNIPYRDIKKESFQDSLLRIDQVYSGNAEAVGKKLSVSSTEIEKELKKFRNYWSAPDRRKPKSGLAVFRRCLRKAIEFRNGRKSYAQICKSKTSKSCFERFLTGGVRAIGMIEQSEQESTGLELNV